MLARDVRQEDCILLAPNVHTFTYCKIQKRIRENSYNVQSLRVSHSSHLQHNAQLCTSIIVQVRVYD